MDLYSGISPPDKVVTGGTGLSLYGGLSVTIKKSPKRTSTSHEEKTEVKKAKKDDETVEEKVVYSLKAYKAERQGEREDMQDASVLLDDCTEDFSSCNCGQEINRVAFYGLFDGHGGSRAANFVKKNLYENIKKHFPKDPVEKFDIELKKRLTTAFKDTDKAFLTQANQVNPAWRDGSTATCVLVINDKLYVANIGDSKTILIREGKDGKPNVLPLTKDHSPNEYEERQRIQKAGGFVRDGRVQGVLEVSRSFGDSRFKKYVICTPDITKYTLTDKDRYLLIACDGLWKGFQIQEAVNFINGILNDTAISNIDERYEKACGVVAGEAIRRGSSDNVTVVIVRIQ